MHRVSQKSFESRFENVLGATVSRLQLAAILAIATAVFFVSIVLWYGPVDGLVHASGQVRLHAPNAVLKAKSTGQVAIIHKIEGSNVQVGDPILEIENGHIRSRLGVLEQRMAKLTLRIERMEADLNSEVRVFTSTVASSYPKAFEAERVIFESGRRAVASRKEQLALQLAQLARTQSVIEARLVALRARHAHLDGQASKVRHLAMLGIKSDRDAAELELSVSDARAEILASEARLAELSTQIALAKNSSNLIEEDKKAELNNSILDARSLLETLRSEYRIVNKELEDTVVTATANGIIFNMSDIQIGSWLGLGQTISQILPSRQDARIVAFLPAADIGLVSTGQKVVVRFGESARPIETRLIWIAPDAAPMDGNGRPFHEIHVELDLSKPELRSSEFLRDGMEVEITLIASEGRLTHIF